MSYPKTAFLSLFLFFAACTQAPNLSELNLRSNCNKIVCIIQPNDCDRCLNNLNKFFAQNTFKQNELSILLPDFSEAQKQAFFQQILKVDNSNLNIATSSNLQLQLIELANLKPFSSTLLVFNENNQLTEQYPFKKFTLQQSKLQTILNCP